MLKRFWPRSVRAKLVAAILIVAVAVLAGSFFALHQGTGADLRGRIDDQLQEDLAEFQASPAGESRNERELRSRSQDFIANQGYHAESRIFAIQIGDGEAVVTNEQELIEGEISEGEEEDDDDDDEIAVQNGAQGLLDQPRGLRTVDLSDDSRLRVLTSPILSGSERIGTLHVAESLGSVGVAQAGLRDTLVIVAAIALVVLVVAALWIATLIARPLKRMAGFAAEIEPEGLDRRLEMHDGPTEVRSLADSFNRMLDRLQRSFEHEREFVADASHELRTPVTVARGELELLRREVGPAEQERVDSVRRELRRMERLVDEMLTLASADSGTHLRREPVPVADILDDLRRDLPLMGPRDYSVARLGGLVAADPDRIAQVFRNLVQNAVVHTGEGGSVRVDAVAKGDRVRFEVHDDGPGFAPEEAERLFDRFYRTEGGRERNGAGSGLGLAIAKAIVEAHGGTIWAESDPAGGAAVAFELPGYSPA